MKLTVKELSKNYNLNQAELEYALEKIKNGKVILYAMSGKMGAGKDTLGDLICEDLENKGYDVMFASYSTPMKKEITEIIECLNSSECLHNIAEKFNTTVNEIIKLSNILNGNSIYERTDSSRRAIQYWGTDVRRKQKRNYWVNKLIQLTVEAINNNKSVYISDVRFVDEADSIIDLNGKIIRLDVPEKVRCERILKRDKINPTEEHLTHVSETGLDQYKFEIIFDGCETLGILTKQAINYIFN